MSRALIWLAARVVPASRRAEWIERWQAELFALEQSGGGGIGATRLALGALPDAAAEAADGLRDGWSWSGLMADVRDAWRAALAAPVATLTAVAILGLGAASAATIFALADALLLRPPPGLTDPDRLVQIGRKDPANFDNFSYPNYRDLRDGLTGAVDLAAWANASVVVGDGLGADVARAQLVSANYFRVVGATFTSGVGFPGDDDGFRSSADVVVSQAFWHRWGSTAGTGGLIINGQTARVVGVTSPGFVGVDAGSRAPQIWMPLAALPDVDDRLVDRGWSWLQTVGRVAPGVSMDAARAAALGVHARLAEDFEQTIGETVTFVEGVGLDPPGRAIAGQLISVFMTAAVLVLVVATANVAGLQFSRNLGRRHELAIRLSLGASRRRVFRGLLVEQTLVAAAAGTLAFGVTWWTTAWLLSVLPYDVSISLGPTPRQLVFAVAVSVVTSAVVGLWPIVAVVRSVPGDVLRARRVDRRRLRAGQLLVGVELAVSAVLLCLTVLMARSVFEAARVDPGFETSGVAVVSMRPLPGRSAEPATLVDAALERLAAVPGVVAAAAATSLPVVDPQSSRAFTPAGAEYRPDPQRIPVVTASVRGDFFDALGVRLLAGRPLGDGDRIGAEVPVVVNEALADRLFQEPDPAASLVGRTFENGSLVYRVVGVASATALRSVRDRALPAMWMPADPRGETPSRLIVRVAPGTDISVPAIRTALEPMAGELMVRAVDPLAPLVAGSLADTRLLARLAMVFGALALLISAVGLNAVSSAQALGRRHEIGVRLAVGASPGVVVRSMLRSAVVTAVLGSLAGVLGIVLAARQLGAFLFNVQAADPLAIGTTVAVLSVTSIAAVIGPALRAGRTDPLIVMRESP